MSDHLVVLLVMFFAGSVTVAFVMDQLQAQELHHWRRVSNALIRRLHARGAIVTIHCSEDGSPISIIWPDESHAQLIDSARIVE